MRWIRSLHAAHASRDIAPASTDDAELDAEFYRDWYSDLVQLRPEQLRRHWLQAGRVEGRYPNLARLLSHKQLDPELIPPDFDWRIYLARYDDLAAAGLRTRAHALVHYLEHGRMERRSGAFNHDFYTAFYPDLAPFAQDREGAIEHWLRHGREEGRAVTLRHLLEQRRLAPDAVPEEFEWSPPLLPAAEGEPGRNWQLLVQALLQEPPGLLPLWGDTERDTEFYLSLAANHERAGNEAVAVELYAALLCRQPMMAHAALGNIAFRGSGSGPLAHRMRKLRLAQAHYRQALFHDPNALGPSIGFARTLGGLGRHEDGLVAAEQVMRSHPESSEAEMAAFDLAKDLWWSGWADADCTAAVGDRNALFEQAERSAFRVAEACRLITLRGSEVDVRSRLIFDRVLIIADCQLPQCVRYRIEQKIEQLTVAGIQAQAVSWADADQAQQALAFHDQVIFYRVPAFPQVARLIASARALGKLTFYEIDDLIFEPQYPPPLETYGGYVGAVEYLGLVKGAALFRAAAALCDFGIASTQPLADHLAPIVRRNRCFVHRNALDRLSPVGRVAEPPTEETVTLFYGSATRAHNSDFIDEALPAIARVLEEHAAARLTVAGYLQLPPSFLRRFGDRVRLLPMTEDLDVYWDRLAKAQINLAVLKPDPMTDCKSELKWIEAGLMGIPSIVSPTRNYLDVVRDGEDALLAKGPEGWYAALSHLVDSPEARLTIGTSAQNRVLAEYGVAAMADNLRGILERSAAELQSGRRGGAAP